MEDQTNFLLDWANFCNGKNVEGLTESLLITTMELEAARFKAQEELKQKDNELIQLKQVLNTVVNEKLEAQNRYQKLVSSIEDGLDHITNGGLSSSDCEESIISSPVTETAVWTLPTRFSEDEFGFLVKALPEKGKLLEAVIKAGPLLQSLMIAGPLPQWRHPPPQLEAYRIPPPPVGPIDCLIGKLNRKRGFPEGCDFSIDTKFQKHNMNDQHV